MNLCTVCASAVGLGSAWMHPHSKIVFDADIPDHYQEVIDCDICKGASHRKVICSVDDDPEPLLLALKYANLTPTIPGDAKAR